MQMFIPHQKSPFDWVSIDDFCPIQSFLWWLQNDGFLPPALSPCLLDGCWHFAVDKKPFCFLLIYRFVIGVDSWISVFSMVHHLLLCVIILVLTFSQIWPVRVRSNQLLGPWDVLPSFFEHFLFFSHNISGSSRTSPGPAIELLISQTSPGSFTWARYWGTRFGHLGTTWVFYVQVIYSWSVFRKNLPGREGNRSRKGGGWVRVCFRACPALEARELGFVIPVSPSPLQG